MADDTQNQPRLGELLVAQGKITPWQVEEALARQREWGMRIGSCLVGLGHLSLESVSESLAEHMSVPEAKQEAFDAVDAATIDAVPRSLCAKHQVFPLKFEGRRLHLAMRDPNDLGLVDGLAFSLGYIVEAFVAPQLRLLQYLKKHHRIRWESPFPDRFDQDERLQSVYVVRYEKLAEQRATLPELALGLVAELATTQALSAICRRSQLTVERVLKVVSKLESMGIVEPRGPGGATIEAPAVDAPIVPEAISHTQPYGVPASAEAPAAPPTDEAPVAAPSMAHTAPVKGATMSPKAVLERINNTNDREELLDLLVHPIVDHTALSVLFVVRGTLAVGYRINLDHVSADQLEALAIPLTTPSLLQHAYQLPAVVRGRARDDPTQYQIANRVQAPKPKEVCVAPVSINERVVNLLCIQSFDGTTFPDGAVEGLRILTNRAAEAFARIVRYRNA